MKKMLLTVVFCVAMSSIAEATCWGTAFNGKDGHSYCVSTQKLKWYAALGWCASQGRRLTSLNEACDYGTEIYGQTTDQCPNIAFDSGVYIDANGVDIRSYGRVWTANAYDGIRAMRVEPGNGVVAADRGGDWIENVYPILCY